MPRYHHCLLTAAKLARQLAAKRARDQCAKRTNLGTASNNVLV